MRYPSAVSLAAFSKTLYICVRKLKEKTTLSVRQSSATGKFKTNWRDVVADVVNILLTRLVAALWIREITGRCTGTG